MAVKILNDMPDAAVHRGDPVIRAVPDAANDALADWVPRATRTEPGRNRPLFIAVTAAIHVVAILGFLSIRHITRTEQTAPPIVASLIEAHVTDEAPPMASPPMPQVAYSLPTPDIVTIDLDTITPPPVNTAVASTSAPSQTAVPPMVESVEYVRPPAPVYPRESSRRREYGTVLLRVLVDASGHAAQILVERSSGFERLDDAAREAVERALFRPHEVNGIRQAAQVLIPIEFTRRAS